MKKAIFTLAIALQVFVAAAHKKSGDQELTVYKQPSKDTQVIKVISNTDEVALVRPFNNRWSIVTINKEVGYMSTFQLGQYNKKQKAAAIAKAKASKSKQNSRS